ncbi:L-histidine carboxy-lyase (histamine-forming) [Algoriphagus zhangzhouensis]|uniref:Glutamate or tyrosine decarboxylase n=2 Tax=Algoriphagus zhangzhouensis TaxID=1073327 RepID=A0A1M7Z7K7_9BACT|nr:L-histidine carboxy-lyase (histamine-forming) [Algoriphagus zhangzhouensis]SHO60760.1 Glutamate or tyrosine decarboxylase [Algoriphagus zhangzhouensis]
MKFWKKLSTEQRLQRVQQALKGNVDFYNDASLGYPASRLDEKVFPVDAPFLKDAPVLSTFVANPNHIGCHTFGTSESAFQGTHEIERDVLDMIAVDLFKAEEGEYDGYISPGGTEANIQALWIYRNEFKKKYNAKLDEIAILASEDTHYSIPKGANLLTLDWIKIPVDSDTRQIAEEDLKAEVSKAIEAGKKYFIAISNMGTTMFGSVDDPNLYSSVLKSFDVPFRMHIDGAYGGFVFPFSENESQINFQNTDISSITIDAHKMLQAPYGTGIFICRKGLIENVLTTEAQYVEGMDLTLCGSRSGANAIAVWVILTTYGPHKWFEKISILKMRTNYLCKSLDEMNVPYFREPEMNIVTIRSQAVPKELAKKYSLVPESHTSNNEWYKIVLMDHVEVEHLKDFIQELKVAIA